MPEKSLSELLEELHGELGKIKVVDDEGRRLLRQLDGDIRALLDNSSGLPADVSVLGRLQDTIDHFEESHPDLTSMLSHLITVLNNAGI